MNDGQKLTLLNSQISTVLYPIKDDHGANIQGPKWKSIDGQCLDKFLRGREVSQKWCQYGPVYRIWSGVLPEVVITRPEDVKIFHSDSSTHMKSRSSNGGWLFHELLGNCMGLINGDQWKQVRAHFNRHFIHRAVESISGHVELAAAEHLQSLDTKGAESIEVHAAKIFSRFSFMTTAEYLYGPLTEDEKEKLWSIGQESLALMGNVLAGGVYRFRLCQWARPHSFRRLRRFQTEWRTFNEKLMKSREMSNDKQLPAMEAWRGVESGCVSTDEVLQTLSEMLFANLDVSTHVLSWLVIYLAENADIQRQTSVVIDTLAINYNEQFWGKDSARFDPYRFRHLSSLELRYNLFTFGLGTRKCLGQHFAEAMLKQFVYQLVARYEVELSGVEARKAWGSQPIQDTWVPISDARLVLKPIG
ncbi:hypothetical protein N7504_006615 [Penicillium tannophilum]|nr:hypothetical protein N7504_006615 [Penicillium tannophilum]